MGALRAFKVAWRLLKYWRKCSIFMMRLELRLKSCRIWHTASKNILFLFEITACVQISVSRAKNYKQNAPHNLAPRIMVSRRVIMDGRDESWKRESWTNEINGRTMFRGMFCNINFWVQIWLRCHIIFGGGRILALHQRGRVSFFCYLTRSTAVLGTPITWTFCHF